MPYARSRKFAGDTPESQRAAVDSLFARTEPHVRATYDALVAAAEECGPIWVQPSKSSIHIMAKSAIAGVHTRKVALLVTIKSGIELKSPRIRKIERVSRNRFYFDILMDSPAAIDAEVQDWLREAYELSC